MAGKPSALSILGDAQPSALASLGDSIQVKAHSRARPGRKAPGTGAMVGGLAGGLLGKAGGAPGAIAGAAAGGALGEGIQQGIEQGSLGGPGPPLAGAGLDFGQMGRAGLEQGAYELGGGLVGQGLHALGGGAMRLAMKASPEVAQAAIREGITATKAGLQRLSARITQAAQAERQIVAAASGHGIGWQDPHIVADAAFAEVASKLRGAPKEELSKLAKLQDKFLSDNPGDRVSPLQGLDMRKWYDNASRTMKEQATKGGIPKNSVLEMWNNALSNIWRDALRNDIPAISDPAVYEKLTGKGTLPSELQQLREVAFPAERAGRSWSQRAAATAGRASVGASVGGTIGALSGSDTSGRLERGTIGALAGAALMSPSVLSQMALVMRNPALQDILGQVPRAAGAAMQGSQ